MTEARTLVTSVRGYLKRAGWTQQEPGAAGALWTLTTPASGTYGDAEGEPALAVPFDIRLDSPAWHGLTDRVAAYEQRPVELVADEIEHFYIDVTRFRAANDYVIARSIPLTAGVDLVASAYKMLRASATTARQAKGHIAGGFSKLGDKIVEEARLAHTEEGSYILPVLLPLTEPEPGEQDDLWRDEPGIAERVALEPPERRVTRTLAQALTAVNTLIVRPAKEPTAAVVAPLVAAGASRELIVAVSQVLSDPAVAALDTSFAWAGGAAAPGSVPEHVSLPSDANPLLERTSRLLRASRRDPSVQMSGLVVEVRHVPGDPVGSVVLQTIRQGRPVEVRVHLGADKLDPVHDWMRDSRTIVVEGQVQRDPGKRLRVDQPGAIYPLDESFLPNASGTEG
jgi:hypothetical protein